MFQSQAIKMLGFFCFQCYDTITKKATKVYFLIFRIGSYFAYMKLKNNQNQVMLMSFEEFQELVRDFKELKEIVLEGYERLPTPPLLRTSEVKKLLKVSDSTLAGLRQSGEIPYTKIGGTIYYLEKDIQNLILTNYSKSNEN